MSKEIKIFWGILFGFITGFAFAKLYQTWAILFRMKGVQYAGIQSWRTGQLWEVAVENPMGFLITMEVLFSIIGYVFVKTTLIKKDK